VLKKLYRKAFSQLPTIFYCQDYRLNEYSRAAERKSNTNGFKVLQKKYFFSILFLQSKINFEPLILIEINSCLVWSEPSEFWLKTLETHEDMQCFTPFLSPCWKKTSSGNNLFVERINSQIQTRGKKACFVIVYTIFMNLTSIS